MNIMKEVSRVLSTNNPCWYKAANGHGNRASPYPPPEIEASPPPPPQEIETKNDNSFPIHPQPLELERQ